MTVTSNAAIRQTTAINAPRTTSSAQPAKLDAGSFSRSAESAKSAPVEAQGKDQVRGHQRAPGAATINQMLNAMPPNKGERIRTARELQFLEKVCKQRMHPGQLSYFSLFGQTASLSIGSRNEVALRGKFSANPGDEGGLITFKDGQIIRASLDFGRPMTSRQQGTLVAAAYDKIALGLLNKH